MPQAMLRPGMPGFVPPANMPNINFNAPIIRLGTTAKGTAYAAPVMGKSASGPQFVRETILDLQPPTEEEQVRNIFIGSIPKDFDDVWMEKIVRVGNIKLDVWRRKLTVCIGSGKVQEVD